jgi:hypothetical protein
MRAPIVVALLLVASCGAPPGPMKGDPCDPGGHIHRDPAGDWCHCDRGFKAALQGLACEVDPNFTGRTTLDLGNTDERACWHASRGPFAMQTDGSRIDQFLTFYTLDLPARSDGLHTASASYRAAVSAPHVLSVNRSVNVTVHEVLPTGGAKEVPVLVTRATTFCSELTQQYGFELVSRVEYRFDFGPSQQAQARFVLDQVE